MRYKFRDFIKSKAQFENKINTLEGISITKNENSKLIQIESNTTAETIKLLLAVLRMYKVAFSLFDSLYPSLSDSGASIDYSQERNDIENSWSMTIGNHGWSGGIYTINDNNIVIQILNLVNQNLINGIRIGNVNFFAHYDKENIDFNRNQNALIYGIHSGIDKIKSDYLIFGRFSSDNWSPYYIYKLTNNDLWIDKSGNWHSQRHSKTGYVFTGEKLSEDIELALHTGGRREEISDLKWNMIKEIKGRPSYVEVRNFKVERIKKEEEEGTVAPKIIPVTKGLFEVLKRIGYYQKKGSDDF